MGLEKESHIYIDLSNVDWKASSISIKVFKCEEKIKRPVCICLGSA